MKDYYTLKEIVFGLRKEQLRIAEKLRLLESKIVVSNNINYDASRIVFDIDNHNALTYKLKEKSKLLENIINVLTFNFDRIKDKCYVENLRKLENGDYRIGGLGGMYVSIPSEEQLSFNKIVDELMNDDFIKNGPFGIIGNSKWRYESNLLLSPTITNYTGLNNDKSNSLFYLARNDMFNLINIYGSRKSCKDIVNELMNLKFLKKNFPEYIQYIIDNNDETKKDVVIQGDARKGINEFYVNDERDAFVLVKKK